VALAPTCVLTLVNAGQRPPSPATGTRRLQLASGPGLGLSRLMLYEQDRVALAGDDRLMLRRAGLIGRPTTGLQQDLDRPLSASDLSERDPDALLTTLLRTLTTTNITDIALLAVGSTEVVCPDHRTPAALPRGPAGGERAVPRAPGPLVVRSAPGRSRLRPARAVAPHPFRHGGPPFWSFGRRPPRPALT